MTSTAREEFSFHAAPEVVFAMRATAKDQGRQIEAVLDEALRDYIDRQQKDRPRRHSMTASSSGLDEFDEL